MQIHYLFSRNKKIGSKLICWGSSFLTKDLEKIPSHVAILLNETIVIESTMESGVRLVPYKQWKSINEELYKIEFTNRLNGEDLQDLLFEMWGKKYDKLGLLYFSLAVLKYMLFKTKLPKDNKWERENYFFCTEFAGRLNGSNYSMVSPAMMCSSFLKEIHDNP